MKWSDGAPLTSADLQFAYEDILLNEELTPVPPGNLRPGDELAALEVVDDYTVRLSFAVPYPPILAILALTHEPIFLYPKHYLSQFHIDYNDDADAQAKAAGFETWNQWFASHRPRNVNEDTARPGVDTWTLDRVDNAGFKYYTRNPYYYKVDTAGNQLPMSTSWCAYWWRTGRCAR